MRYINLYKILIKQSLIKLIAYRSNFFLVFIINSSYFAVQLILLQVIFSNVESLAGWTKYQMFFYIATFNLIDSLWIIGPYFNLMQIPELIRTGRLDYYITKPVNSQFLISLRNVEIGGLTNLIASIAMIIYVLIQGKISITLWKLIIYIVAIFHALIMEYSIYFIMVCFSFWIIKADFVERVYGTLCYFSNRPVDIYKGAIRFILSYILPFGLVLTIPSKCLVKNTNISEYLIFIVLSWCFFSCTILFWKFSLSKYSSASS